MKFSSLSANTTVVAADVVSLDSELPLKSRGSISSAQGEIPKLGMIKAMNESQLQQIKNMRARGVREQEIIRKLFSDIVDGVKGVNERLDIMFLQAWSTGITLITDENNTGTGVRIDFGIPKDNQFGSTKDWGEPDATPVDDIENVLANARANGYVPTVMAMDKATYNGFRMNEQVRKAFAGYQRVAAENIFRVSSEELNTFVSQEWGLQVIVIDKMVQIEKGGKRTAIEPWERGNVVFSVGTNLGSLTWSELAEVDSPVDGVEYGTVDNFILTSIFRTNNPLKENSSVQALALPVLDNTDGIFIMNTKEATASLDTQVEGDTNYNYKGTNYTRASVVDGINAARTVDDGVAEAKLSNADSTLAKKIDQLSEAGIEIFEGELIAV